MEPSPWLDESDNFIGARVKMTQTGSILMRMEPYCIVQYGFVFYKHKKTYANCSKRFQQVSQQALPAGTTKQ